MNFNEKSFRQKYNNLNYNKGKYIIHNLLKFKYFLD